MFFKFLFVIIGILCSVIGFFVVRWMSEMDKKWESVQGSLTGNIKDVDKLTTRVEKLEGTVVINRNCNDTASLLTQKVNRERYRINAIEDMLRAGGLKELVRKFNAKHGEDQSGD